MKSGADEGLATDLDRKETLVAELAERTAAAGELQDELQRILPALKLHRKADHDLANGLDSARIPAGSVPVQSAEASGSANGGPQLAPSESLARVRAALADIADQLQTIDGQLRDLLDRHCQAYEKRTQMLTW